MSSGLQKSNEKSPFGAYDIRGIYGENITEMFAYKLGHAFSSFLGAGKRIAVGHDSRLSSPALTMALIAGIESTGNKAENLGLASTPRVYWHGSQKQFGGSIAVTASHLAAKHNGFKLCRELAIPISSEDGLKDIRKLMDENFAATYEASGLKHEQALNSLGLSEYLQVLQKSLSVKRHLRIVIDIGGSPVGEELNKLLSEESLDVVMMDSTPDGNFSRRSPNPMDDGALDDLCARVEETGADFGAAFDGDGDRVVFVDESGNVVAPDLVTAVLSAQILKEKPGAKIMYDLRSSRAVPEFIEELGGVPLKCRVGHSFIKADMRREKIALAGELSSHYYWADLAYTDNAVKTLIEVINLLSREERKMSQIILPLNRYYNSGEINFACGDVKQTLESLQKAFSDAAFDFTDGITAEFSNWWFNARGSHTEPLLRLCIGAENSELLADRKATLKTIVESSQMRTTSH